MRWTNALAHDLRLGARTLAHNPGFAASAITILAFGIGLSVVVFTVANSVLRRPLPIHDADRVVVLWGTAKGSVRNLPLTPDHFASFRREARLLQGVAATISAGSWPMAVRDGSRAFLINVGPVTGNFFAVLGTNPVLGRTLRPDDDVLGAAPVAVISYRAWHTFFGGEPRVIGHRLSLHQRRTTYTIVGVAPAGLGFPTGTDLWVPVTPFGMLEAVPLGRLAPGVTITQAAAELRASFQRRPASEWRGLSAVATPLPVLLLDDVRPSVLVLSVGAALLLLIACLNAANLVLVRAAGRTQEIAVRRALGAGRGRLVRQLFAENCLLALVAGALGVVLADLSLRALLAIAPPEIPRLDEIRLNGVSLGLTTLVGLAAVLLCGLLPAVWASGDIGTPLRAGDRSGTQAAKTRRAQHALVVFQIGMALVVLTVAGLLGRSLRELEHLDTGFAPDELTIVELAWPQEKFDTSAKVDALYDRLIPRLEALPGVASASPVNVAPFTGAAAGWDGVFTPQASSGSTEPAVLNLAVVGEGYFQTLGLPVVLGRSITSADRDGSPRVAVISEGVARRFWPGQNPVGKRVGLDAKRPEDWWTVVGLVPETRYRAIREPAPTVYLPYRQFGDAIVMVTTMAVRTTVPPSAATPAIRRTVHDTDPDVIVTTADPMPRLLAGQLARPRLSAVLTAAFGGGALFLAGIGLYAVLAHVVRQRRRELGIRQALGATPWRVRVLVMSHALVMAGTGTAWGLLASLAVGQGLRSHLFGVSPTDPFTLAGVTVLLMTVALVASYRPAKQATAIDAASALRES